jgi:hypothetical protein
MENEMPVQFFTRQRRVLDWPWDFDVSRRTRFPRKAGRHFGAPDGLMRVMLAEVNGNTLTANPVERISLRPSKHDGQNNWQNDPM